MAPALLHVMSSSDVSYTIQEAGGDIVGYSWGHVTCLIEMYCGREMFLWGKNLAFQLHTRAHWGEERMRRQFANGNLQPQAPLSAESSTARWQGLFAFSYISEALVEIQSLNIESKAGDKKITLLSFAPNHTQSDR